MAADKVEINTASLEQLDQITAVGPAIAQRIIDARPFSSVDDLLKVKGIGDKTLQKIKDQGLAYIGVPGSQTQIPVSVTPAPSQPQPTPTLEPITITYPSGIFINEILPAPEGSDDTNEYIEIYNGNTTDTDISGWKLQDIWGTQKTFVLAQNTTIAGNGYLILKRPETNIIINNDEDGLNLLSPDEKIVDSVSFTKAATNQSYNKTVSDWQWSTTLTPGAKNIITGIIKVAKATKKSTAILPIAQKTDNKYLSALSESPNLNLDNTASNPWLLFLVVLIATLMLGIIILVLKIKFIKH